MSSLIGDLLKGGPTLSYELFPPKTPEGLASLRSTVHQLRAINPSFVSVTYGAGGSTRETTLDLVLEFTASCAFPVMPHLTCVGHTRADIETLISQYGEGGVSNVLSLAGDPPLDPGADRGEFTYAIELAQLIRDATGMSIGVAAFPEVHPRSESRQKDRQHLAEKLEVADFAITQFFFRADDYFRLVDELAALGCDRPIIPGVQPLVNPATIKRFAAINGAWFPEDLAASIEEAEGEDRLRRVVDATSELIEELVEGGVPGIHLYCLNRGDIACELADAVPRS